MNNKPQVLLLGNGLNLSYGGISWSKLLEIISVRHDFDIKSLSIPMPLQAILLTNDNIKDAIKKHSECFWGSVDDSAGGTIFRKLLSIGFDDILTTNYSYELEIAALGLDGRNPEQLKRSLKSVNRCNSEHIETKYLLHTYNHITYNDVDNRIWHIHGESRKPDSMILGHYWYGNMLSRMKTIFDTRGNNYQYKQSHGIPIECDSWLDSFVLGDVYVLGFSYDVSELDLWWLLNRKVREKASVGRVFFYEMQSDKRKEKTELLKLFNVDVENLGFVEPDKNDPNASLIYRDFYNKAIGEIEKKVILKGE